MTPADTHDPSDEELALPAFEDALWATLRAEHARTRAAGSSGATEPPASSADDAGGTTADPPIVVPVDAPRRRHRALRRGLAAAAVVALLAGVGAVVADDGDDPPTVAGPSTTDAPTTTSAPAPLEDRILVALDEAAATTVTATEERRGGVLVQQSWGDDVSGGRRILRYREDDKALFDLGPAEAPLPGDARLVEVVLRAVDHCFRQWSVAPGALIGGPLGDLTRAVERGDLQPDGTAVVEGRELLVLRRVATAAYEVDPETGLPDLDSEPTSVELDETQATYLDPETLLPVLERSGIGTGVETTIWYRLLPREPMFLKLLVPFVPTGYTEVDAVPTDEERDAAC